MIGSKIRHNNRFYTITEEEDYSHTLEFEDVFKEFGQCYHVIVPGKAYRDYSIGGTVLYLPPEEVVRTGVILPLQADDIQFDTGGTHTHQSIKVYTEHKNGFKIYYARRIDEPDDPIIACYLTQVADIGDTELQVDDTGGFSVGMSARIFAGTDEVVTTSEYVRIQNLTSTTLGIEPLKHSYEIGACILEMKKNV